ncbi:MAG: polymerase [Treponema sp.]|nr:polymerase [Treponema sp.]
MKVNAAVMLCFLTLRVYGQTRIDISGSVDWDRMEINAAVNLNLASANLRIPAERVRGEEILYAEYPRLLRPSLLNLPVDSSETLGDLLEGGEISFPAFDAFLGSAHRVPPALSADLGTLFTAVTVSLHQVSGALIRHRRPWEAERLLSPMPGTSYTGIIIIADEALAVHGRHTTALPLPCLFPKIWDTGMNLIYERNMVDPETAAKRAIIRYAAAESIFRPTPSGLSPELQELVGARPLRILARGVFGVRPTDPIIDREDALLILSSEENRRLLREGRVAIVLNQEVLKSPL